MDYGQKINQRGVSLIIVIFAMMLFSVLGWTLAVMQSGDFEANLRNLDSERTLGLAEAGAQWGLRQLASDASWRTDPTNPDADCNDSDDWLLHTLSPGQYRVCCRNATTAEENAGFNAVIEVSGFVPTYTNYRATRQVELLVKLGSFDKVLQAKNLFNWTPMHSGSRINGDIQAAFYDRNGNCNPIDGTGCNEPGIDYDPLPTPVLPADGAGDDRIIAALPYPSINMVYYETQAGVRVWDLARTSTIEAILPGNRIRVSDNIFTAPASQWEYVTAVRNLTQATWDVQNWRVITRRLTNSIVELESSVTWAVGEQIRVVKRYRGSDSGGGGDLRNRDLWYIKGDVLFDVRDPPLGEGNINSRRTSVVAEGDIVIKGDNTVNFSERPFNYPNIATQNGNIISTDTPDGGDEGDRRRRRDFGSLIYTQNGNIDFNYLNAESVIGNNVILDGQVRLQYDARILNLTGFIWGLSEIKWQEQ